jgi:hypothetical protein
MRPVGILHGATALCTLTEETVVKNCAYTTNINTNISLRAVALRMLASVACCVIEFETSLGNWNYY